MVLSSHYLSGVAREPAGEMGDTGEVSEAGGDVAGVAGDVGVVDAARAGGSSPDIVMGMMRSTDTPLKVSRVLTCD